MRNLLLLILILSTFLLQSQIHIKTDSKVEGNINILNTQDFYTNFHNDIYLKSKLNGDRREKVSYYVLGIFKRDTSMGCNIGYDFDLMPEYFEKSGGNTFRHWNRIRARIDVILNDKTGHFQFEEYIIDLFDAQVSLSYLNIPQTLRGDQKLTHRKGYFEFLFSMRAMTFDTYAHLRFKPWGNTWIKMFHDSRHNMKDLMRRFIGLDFELETNPKGYQKGTTKLTKDIYKGFSFIFGGKFDLVQMNPYAYIGIHLGLRNH